MSDKRPNTAEILARSTKKYPEMAKYLCKSLINLARSKFRKMHGRNASIEDSQEIWDIFEASWVDYYIHGPIEKKRRYAIVRDAIYRPLIYTHRIKVDIQSAATDFLRYKLLNFIETPDRIPPNRPEEKGYWYDKILKKTGYLAGTIDIRDKTWYIYENHLDEFIDWVIEHKDSLSKPRKSEFIDYSELAYNGVTDDF